MRNILFRCKLQKTGEWVYWDMLGRITTHTGKISTYTRKTKHGEIYYHFAHQLWHMLDRSTVGQLTGMNDKNGKRIFEGDMLNPFDDEIDKMVVEFHHGGFLLCLYGERGYMGESGWCEEGNYGVVECEPLSSYGEDIEVIGNVHDNPELMGGAGDDEH